MIWPFNKNSSKTIELQKSDSRYVEIPSLNFYGSYSESPNGRFLIAWRNFGLTSDKGNGIYVFVKDGKFVCSGNLERPHFGKVADNGVYILEDWLFQDRYSLQGTLNAYSPQGVRIMNHRFSANIQKTDLSPNGNFAVVLLSSSATDDGCRLAFFNLAEKKLLWKLEPQVWPKSFIFNEKEKRLGLVESQGRGVYEYSYEGIFIDSERWEREHNIPISSWDYLRLAQIKLNDNFGSKLNPETANEIIKLMSQALSMDLNNWPYEQAKAYRKLGEIYEEIGNIALAIENYELAIISYPKIGVKRRLDKLKAQYLSLKYL